MPKLNRWIETEEGRARVVGHHLLRGSVDVELENGNRFEYLLPDDDEDDETRTPAVPAEAPAASPAPEPAEAPAEAAAEAPPEAPKKRRRRRRRKGKVLKPTETKKSSDRDDDLWREN